MSAEAVRHAFAPNWAARAGLFALALYAAYAASQLDVTLARLMIGLGEAGWLLGKMLPPSFARWELLAERMPESLQIASIASAVGTRFLSRSRCSPRAT